MNARQRRKARRAVLRGLTTGDWLNNRRYEASLDHYFIGVDYGAGSGSYAPRYDVVFFQGVAWLNTL